MTTIYTPLETECTECGEYRVIVRGTGLCRKCYRDLAPRGYCGHCGSYGILILETELCGPCYNEVES